MKSGKMFLTALAAAAMSCTVYAQDINVSLNGTIVDFPNQVPVIVEGRTLIPLRGVFDNMGYAIDWNGETKTVTLTKNSDTITIAIGQASYSLNGQEHAIDVPAQIINSSTMLPLRAIADATGSEVLWDGEKKIASIISAEGREPQLVEGTVVADNQEEADFITAFSAINKEFNDSAMSFISFAKDKNSMTDIKAVAEQAQSMHNAAVAAKKAVNELSAPAKYADLKAKSVEYMQSIEEFTKIMADMANGTISLDEYKEKLSTAGTDVMLKEAAYKAAAEAIIE